MRHHFCFLLWLHSLPPVLLRWVGRGRRWWRWLRGPQPFLQGPTESQPRTADSAHLSGICLGGLIGAPERSRIRYATSGMGIALEDQGDDYPEGTGEYQVLAPLHTFLPKDSGFLPWQVRWCLPSDNHLALTTWAGDPARRRLPLRSCVLLCALEHSSGFCGPWRPRGAPQPRCPRLAGASEGHRWACPGAGGRCASQPILAPVWGRRWPCCCCCYPPAARWRLRTTQSPSCLRASAWWCATPVHRGTAPSPLPWAFLCAQAVPRWPSPQLGAPTMSRLRWATVPWPSTSTRLATNVLTCVWVKDRPLCPAS